MIKIFLTVMAISCFMMNASFASPHENGIDDFYFGQPPEEIQAQYELTNKEYDAKDNIVNYTAEIPSLDFYGMNVSQPIILGFKDNKLCKISFSAFNLTLDEGSKLYNRIKEFASVQYGKPALPLSIMTIWYTDEINLSIMYVALEEDNKSAVFVTMEENTLSEELLAIFNH